MFAVKQNPTFADQGVERTKAGWEDFFAEPLKNSSALAPQIFDELANVEG